MDSIDLGFGPGPSGLVTHARGSPSPINNAAERERCPSENRNNSGEEVPIRKKKLRFNGSLSLSLGRNYVNDI
ncbi:hypothetical protein LOK49_LG02G02902 [Camellia lanceoleosa]|uniref:Uncharacterized protein n=1 Tax=Camellia lanceoleosa TaxID=1840588 RepID=A0ACC0IRR4_9ERIC|nr:hypothetical protein LOK49_LG02G02902 [Camellia lanceoleosa]